jgi:regulatory protein
MPRDCHDEILLSLIQDNFLNEERFAEAYCRGKTRINQWGRMKIRQGLQQHRVSEYNIESALDQIDSESYKENMRDLMDRKYRYWPASLSTSEKKQKTVRYLLQRGYLYDEIRSVLEAYLQELP